MLALKKVANLVEVKAEARLGMNLELIMILEEVVGVDLRKKNHRTRRRDTNLTLSVNFLFN
jgi:hypothetical protein